MKHLKFGLLLAALGTMLSVAPAAFAQENPRAYTEGNVVVVSYIRTEPGKFDDYMSYLATTYKALMVDYKAAGIILDYAVYSSQPVNEHDPDLILTITYKNLAALDNLDARTDPIAKKVWSTLQASNQASAERGKVRTVLGGRMLRQLNLK